MDHYRLLWLFVDKEAFAGLCQTVVDVISLKDLTVSVWLCVEKRLKMNNGQKRESSEDIAVTQDKDDILDRIIELSL